MSRSTRTRLILAFGLILATGTGSPVSAEQPRLDRYGDPLPEGVLARLGTMRFRHPHGTGVAFAADGQSLVTCGADRTIRTWDAASGRLLSEQRLPAERGASGFVLSSDGRMLAYQDPPRETLYLWDVAKKRIRHKLPLGEKGRCRAIFSPDGKTLVTTPIRVDNATVRAWDVASGKSRLVKQLKRLVNLNTLSFTADSKCLIAVGLDRNLYVWNLESGREESCRKMPEHIYGAAVSPDGRIAAAWSWHNREFDKGLEFWDLANGQRAKDWSAPKVKRVRTVCFSADGKLVLIGTKDSVLIWNPIAGKPVRTLPGKALANLTISPDGKTVAAFGNGSLDNPLGAVLRVWDMATGAPRAANTVEHGHLWEVDGVAFSPDGRIVASSSAVDQSVRLWDAATGRQLRSMTLEDKLTGHSLFFSPDGKNLLTATNSAIVCWEVSTGREIRRHSVFGMDKDDLHRLLTAHLTEDGRTLLGISQKINQKGTKWGLHAWDMESGKRVRFSTWERDGVWLFGYHCFTPDGRWFLLSNGSFRDSATGEERLHLPIELCKYLRSMSSRIAFSRDGSLFAASLWRVIKLPNGQRVEMIALEVWELATLSRVVRFETKGIETGHLAFTPDGRYLISGDTDALRMWDLVSHQVAASRPAPGRFHSSFGSSFASCLAVAPNGRTVATGQQDTAILLWDLSPPPPARPAAPLTAAQREAYWNDLSGTDSARAFTAITRLADDPTQTMSMLRDRLHPAKAPAAADLKKLLANLDDERFEEREAAGKQLGELGELAEAALRQALHGKPSLEMRRRIEGLLAEPRLLRTPEARRQHRAVRVLERIGNSQARQVLEILSQGAVDSRITQASKAALRRLTRLP